MIGSTRPDRWRSWPFPASCQIHSGRPRFIAKARKRASEDWFETKIRRDLRLASENRHVGHHKHRWQSARPPDVADHIESAVVDAAPGKVGRIGLIGDNRFCNHKECQCPA